MVHYVVFANMPFLSFWISFPEPYSAALTRDITYQMFNLNSGCFHITAGPKQFWNKPFIVFGASPKLRGVKRRGPGDALQNARERKGAGRRRPNEIFKI